MNATHKKNISHACGEQVASKAPSQASSQQTKLALDVHAATIVVVRMLDGPKPQPPQTFKPSDFLKRVGGWIHWSYALHELKRTEEALRCLLPAAERALKCGYPERFAQQALGHNPKAVNHAYSKHAGVTVPSLDDWEKGWKRQTEGSDQLSVVSDQRPGNGMAMPRAAVVQVDFKAQQGSVAADAGEMAVAAAAQGG